MLRQRPGHIVKGQTDLPGRIDLTGMSRVIHLVSAVAGAQADVLRFFHNMCGALIVQDVIRPVVGQYRLLHEDSAKPCLRGKEQILDKILFHIHVLIIKPA